VGRRRLNTTLGGQAARERSIGQGNEPGGGGGAEDPGSTMHRGHARWGEVVRSNSIPANP
jgi:hypothetical protein